MIARPHHISFPVNLLFAAILASLPLVGESQVFQRPTATIFGGGEVCEGDSLPAFIYFTGFGPWSAQVNDNDGVYAALKGVESPYTLWLKPEEDNIYFVKWVKDRIGREGDTYGADTVIVKSRTPVEITLERSVYTANEPGVRLQADPPGGIFYGKGVSSGTFYPKIAGTDGSPHLVIYSYTAPNQCISSDSARIDVIHGKGEVYLVHAGDTVNEICNNEDSYTLAGFNEDGIPGSFELRVAGTTQVIPGHITDEDPVDDLAQFDPGELEGVYDISYLYTFKELTVTTVRQVAISSLASLEIGGIPATVCKNGQRFRVDPRLDSFDPGATFTFSGNGITGTQQTGFFFNPSDTAVAAGNNTIILDYRSSLGCRAVIEQDIVVGFVPEVGFEPVSVCIPAEGGYVSFNNSTAGKDSVETWSWDFGDVGSGSANFSSLEEPGHFYIQAGTWEVSLEATTAGGCVSGYETEILLLHDPVADLTWVSDCYIQDEEIAFISRSTTSHGTIDSLSWTFRDAGGGQIGHIGGGAGSDTVRFGFSSASEYQVVLEVYNSGGCYGEISREIILFPTTRITEEGYTEDFNDPEMQWTARSDDGNSSWVWGTPDFQGFVPEEGDLAWYTEIPGGVNGYTENSWVQSHCLDLGPIGRPFIELDLMKSFVPNISGAVLQYQDRVVEGWKAIGNVGEGIGWYNSTSLSAMPGGSSHGWGLNSFQPDRDWVRAKHDLDMIPQGRPFKLRVAIGTNGQQIGNQGFAFDNVRILQRSRFSVLEHFTNSADGTSLQADDVVDAFDAAHRKDVISLQYHTGFPGTDPMNLNNPDPASTRSGVLGVGQVPYSVLNGGFDGGGRYDFSSPSDHPDEGELFRSSLAVPLFTIDLDAAWMTDRVEVTATVTCRSSSYSSNVQLYLAVIETEVLAYTGGNSDEGFRNVVLDMLPTPAGVLLGGAWHKGKETSQFSTWDYAPYVEDVEDLAVVAFVQDRTTGEIMQAAASYKDPTVGIPPPAPSPRFIRVFPNPTRGLLTVVAPENTPGGGRIVVFDLSGKAVFMEAVPAGTELVRTDLGQLDPGLYLLQWRDQSGIRGSAKFSLVR